MGEGGGTVNESDAVPVRPARRRVRVALSLLALVAMLLVGLWAARRPLAGRAIDRTLARAGVPAQYRIEDLEFGRQRLTDVVIGNPADPDLVADWIETGTRLGWDGATVTAVRAGSVRMRGRLVGGRVSLGTIDRLLPASSGGRFALPRLHLDVADARMRLGTPAGVVGLKLSGRGRLDDGFDGRLAAVGGRLRVGECTVDRMTAAVRVRVSDGAPAVVGPARAGRLDCASGSAERIAADLDATFGPSLDRWRGSARVATGAVAAQGARAGMSAGTIGFDGSARGTGGRAKLALSDVALTQARGRRIAVSGEYRIGHGARFAGRVRGEGVAASGVRLDAGKLAGTPVGPIAAALAIVGERAGRAFGFDAALAIGTQGGFGVRVSELTARSVSGARATLSGETDCSGRGRDCASTRRRRWTAADCPRCACRSIRR